MRDAPYAGLFLVVYEQLKSEASDVSLIFCSYSYPNSPEAFVMQPASGASSALIHAVAGGGAGTIATLITHPFDVLKVREQSHEQVETSCFYRPNYKCAMKRDTVISELPLWRFGQYVRNTAAF